MKILLALLLLFFCATGLFGTSYQGIQSFNWIDLTEQAAPVAPSAGTITLYAANDHTLHVLGNGADRILGAGAYVLCYGANLITPGTYLLANGKPTSTAASNTAYGPYLSVSTSGTITAFAWLSTTADATTDYKIWLNSSTSTKIDATGVSGVVTTSIPVVAGDRCAIEFDAGFDPGIGTAILYISP